MDLAQRFQNNPILKPEDIKPSVDGAIVECLLNPGAFTFNGKTGLLMRVAERMEQPEGYVSTLVADDSQPNGVRVVNFALDLNDPSKVLARSNEPIMEPIEEYEQEGFFGNVVFTNGHIVDGDDITLYYGASDTVICGARMKISEILEAL